MPWLVGTALLHSAIVVEKRDALKSWTVLLAILTFSLSLIGTFLVRSGVLTSVHAFAVDPGARRLHPDAAVVATVGGCCCSTPVRAPALKPGGAVRADQPRRRAGAEQPAAGHRDRHRVPRHALSAVPAMRSTRRQVSVGPPFFNLTFIPLMVPLIAAMSVGPLLAWKRGDLAGALSAAEVRGGADRASACWAPCTPTRAGR